MTLSLLEKLKNQSKVVSSPKTPLSNELSDVASIILGGGEGTRLYPLTLTRCKPAISFGGKYRLIDVPISHSIHANCQKIYILTQFLSSSLHNHIFQTYFQHPRASGLIEILTAEQKPHQREWYQGTADAVRQNIEYLLETPADYFLILSGDQLYHIDFQQMYDVAKNTDADLVIAALPVDEKEATRMGILKVDENNFITEFYEKPKDPSILNQLKSSSNLLARLKNGANKQHLGSMGIYLFKRKALVDLLKKDLRADFGKHLIPSKVASGNVAAFLYQGYWEDIGTIESFYKANIALTQSKPEFSLHNQERPIFSAKYDLPPAQYKSVQINQSLICEGAFLEGSKIINSLIGPRTIIHENSSIENSYIMGNDYYLSHLPQPSFLPHQPRIGMNCVIKEAIIDKNVCIGNNVKLINQQQLMTYDSDLIVIRDGIIVVPRGRIIPDNFVL